MANQFRLLPGAALALALAGCGAPGDPELTCDTGGASPTLASAVQAQVFAASCAGCHDVGYMYGDYSRASATAASAVNQKSLYAGSAGTLKVVDPNNLANSSLWLKVLGGTAKGRLGPKGENVMGRMPSDGTNLTEAQLTLLKQWICSGAK
jgi:hypothetical protein